MELISEIKILPQPAFATQAEQAVAAIKIPENLAPLVKALCGNSPYLRTLLKKQPDFFLYLAEHGTAATFTHLFGQDWRTVSHNLHTFEEIKHFLRVKKQQVALLIAIADVAGIWTTLKVTAVLSLFADLSAQLTLDFLLRDYQQRGLLLPSTAVSLQEESGIFILGMGKLGAKELNYSSDIDLIVLYDSAKVAIANPEKLSQTMVRLTRDFVTILEEKTADGYVFRTDLRLRPDPASTPLALSVAAAESYYSSMAQTWERAAMIKARPIAGDFMVADDFLQFLQSFIWRRYLDFNALHEIHALKQQMNAFHNLGGALKLEGHNIKLGVGGIREIEFFAQTHQLIWGGREKSLRQRDTCTVLDMLAHLKLIEPKTAETLKDSYTFLRMVEHRLQMVEDQQTHSLPNTTNGLRHIAVFCGFPTLEAFTTTLLHHLRFVETVHRQLFSTEQATAPANPLPSLLPQDSQAAVDTLKQQGFKQAEIVYATLKRWQSGQYRVVRSPKAQELLKQLTPDLLAAFAKTSDPAQALLHFDTFLEKLPAGVQVFSLLAANKRLLAQLAELMGDAPSLALQLAQHPALLDNLLLPNSRLFFTDASDYTILLLQRLGHLADYEETLRTIRLFVKDVHFHIGLEVLQQQRTVADISLALTAIADAVMIVLIPTLITEFSQTYGTFEAGNFAVIALGKQGSYEMSIDSDLDLVFIYDIPEDTLSNGSRPLQPAVYAARLCQRIVSALTVPVAEGFLYNVDMRLRPSGSAGPVATSVEAFQHYHQESSWTWEHLALTRARVVFESNSEGHLRKRLEAALNAILTRPRDADVLRQNVLEMHAKIVEHHKPRDCWHVKHIRGGMVDIEFIAQYLQLRHAAAFPHVLQRGTIASLQALCDAGVLSAADCKLLCDTYTLWRNIQNLLRLTFGKVSPEDRASESLVRKLCILCGVETFAGVKETIEAKAKDVWGVFGRVV